MGKGNIGIQQISLCDILPLFGKCRPRLSNVMLINDGSHWQMTIIDQ